MTALVHLSWILLTWIALGSIFVAVFWKSIHDRWPEIRDHADAERRVAGWNEEQAYVVYICILVLWWPILFFRAWRKE